MNDGTAVCADARLQRVREELSRALGPLLRLEASLKDLGALVRRGKKWGPYGGFQLVMGIPQNRSFARENPIKTDDLGVPLF